MKRTCLTLLVLLCCIGGIRAQIIGGYVDYRCLGNNRYEVFATLQSPCGYLPPIPSIRALVGSDTLTADSMVFLSTSDITGLSPRCSTLDSCHVDSTMRKITEHRYRGVIDLDTSSTCMLHFFIREATSNYSSTFSNRNFFFVETWVNRCLAGCDESSVFTGSISPYLPQNQNATLNLRVSTAFSNDLFGFFFADARESFSQTATYSGNFTRDRWLTFFGFPNQNLQWPAGLQLHSDGNVLFRPTSANQKATMVVSVSTFRRIGNMNREVSVKYMETTLHVVPSIGQNAAPQLLPPYSKQVCPGEKSCISITTKENDGDSVFVSFSTSGLPGLEITQTGFGKTPTYEVCITPDSSHVSNFPLPFLVMAEDDHCPVRGKVSNSYSFFVREKPKATMQVSMGSCGSVILSSTPLNNPPGGTVTSWRITDSLGKLMYQSTLTADTAHLAGGRYVVELEVRSTAPCFTSYYDTIEVAPSDVPILSVSASPATGCIGDTVTIGSYTNDPTLNYQWADGPTTPLRTFLLPQVNVTFTLTTTRGACTRTHAFVVHGDERSDITLGAYWSDISTMVCYISNVEPNRFYEWTVRDSLVRIGSNVTFGGLPFEDSELKIRAANNYCIVSDSLIVPAIMTGFASQQVSVPVYPNPFRESIYIEESGLLAIQLFNALGQLVPVQTETYGTAQQITPSTGIPKGIYWLRIESDKGIFMEKLVKE